jgi:hypothetical protein
MSTGSFAHVKWSRDPADESQHLPKTARIYCEACGAAWSEAQRLRALSTVRWHQTAPYVCCGARHDPLEDYGRAWRADAVTRRYSVKPMLRKATRTSTLHVRVAINNTGNLLESAHRSRAIHALGE